MDCQQRSKAQQSEMDMQDRYFSVFGLRFPDALKMAKQMVFGQLFRQQWWRASYASSEGGVAALLDRALSALAYEYAHWGTPLEECFRPAWKSLRDEIRPWYDLNYKENRHARLDRPVREDSETSLAELLLVHHDLEESATQRALDLDLLPEEYDLLMMIGNALSYKEAADYLGISVNAVSKRLQKIRKRLRS